MPPTMFELNVLAFGTRVTIASTRPVSGHAMPSVVDVVDVEVVVVARDVLVAEVVVIDVLVVAATVLVVVVVPAGTVVVEVAAHWHATHAAPSLHPTPPSHSSPPSVSTMPSPQ